MSLIGGGGGGGSGCQPGSQFGLALNPRTAVGLQLGGVPPPPPEEPPLPLPFPLPPGLPYTTTFTVMHLPYIVQTPEGQLG